MNPIIEILVSPEGEVRIQTKGFTGSSCRQASRSLEEAFGIRVREQLTAEFHQQNTAVQSHRATSG